MSYTQVRSLPPRDCDHRGWAPTCHRWSRRTCFLRAHVGCGFSKGQRRCKKGCGTYAAAHSVAAVAGPAAAIAASRASRQQNDVFAEVPVLCCMTDALDISTAKGLQRVDVAGQVEPLPEMSVGRVVSNVS